MKLLKIVCYGGGKVPYAQGPILFMGRHFKWIHVAAITGVDGEVFADSQPVCSWGFGDFC